MSVLETHFFQIIIFANSDIVFWKYLVSSLAIGFKCAFKEKKKKKQCMNKLSSSHHPSPALCPIISHNPHWENKTNIDLNLVPYSKWVTTQINNFYFLTLPHCHNVHKNFTAWQISFNMQLDIDRWKSSRPALKSSDVFNALLQFVETCQLFLQFPSLLYRFQITKFYFLSIKSALWLIWKLLTCNVAINLRLQNPEHFMQLVTRLFTSASVLTLCKLLSSFSK